MRPDVLATVSLMTVPGVPLLAPGDDLAAAVGDAIDREVAAMLVERSLGSGGVPPSGAELTVAARRAADGLRREKPFLFAAPERRGVIAAPDASGDGKQAQAALQAAAREARLGGDRRSLIQYLSLRARRA